MINLDLIRSICDSYKTTYTAAKTPNDLRALADYQDKIKQINPRALAALQEVTTWKPFKLLTVEELQAIRDFWAEFVKSAPQSMLDNLQYTEYLATKGND